jgi:DNA-binding LacI/PurR family transcriptional regulator
MRKRVLAAVAELDYRPHGPARALASGNSRTIALFLPSPHLGSRARSADLRRRSDPGDQRQRLLAAAVDVGGGPRGDRAIAATHRADGVILMETLAEDPCVQKLQSAGLPFSLIGRTADTSGISYVDIDFGDAVRSSLAHLVQLGHRCVALFNFPQDQLDAGYTSALIARAAFEEATTELGIRGIHLTCPHPAQEAFAVAARLLAEEPECTAAITTGWQFTGLLGATGWHLTLAVVGVGFVDALREAHRHPISLAQT